MNRTRTTLSFALLIAFLLVGSVPASADDPRDDLRRVSARISSLSAQISDATAERSDLAARIKKTEAKVNETLAELQRVRGEIAVVEVQLDEGARELRDLQAELQELYEKLAGTRAELETARRFAIRSALDAYMTAGSPLPEIAFSATAWTEVAVGIEYHDRAAATSTNAAEHFVEVVTAEKRVQDEVEESEARVEAELADLASRGDELSHLRGELDERNLELEAEQKKQRSILAEVDAQLEEWEHDIVALGREQASIEALIAERAAAAAAAAAAAEAAQERHRSTSAASSAPASNPSPATTAAPTTTAAPSRSGLVRPVPGGVSSGYGKRVHPIHGGVRLHTGWDMNGGMGQPIVAAAGGTVIYAGVKGGYGNTLMVDHGGGMVTLYAHQSKFAVGYGASVGAGQVIGYVGSTGDSTGPHLHFEVRIGGGPVNPSRYL